MIKIYSVLIISLFYITVVASDDTIAFSAIRGVRNGPYISYQTLLVNSSVSLIDFSLSH
jgi:hypothetical protein